MEALDILGDPVRRRMLELLADGELSAGEIGAAVQGEFGISQPAVSHHLKVLRENGFASVRAQGTSRLYSVEGKLFEDLNAWVAPFKRFYGQRLDALETELLRPNNQRSKK